MPGDAALKTADFLEYAQSAACEMANFSEKSVETTASPSPADGVCKDGAAPDLEQRKNAGEAQQAQHIDPAVASMGLPDYLQTLRLGTESWHCFPPC
jgi:hypothetical protein